MGCVFLPERADQKQPLVHRWLVGSFVGSVVRSFVPSFLPSQRSLLYTRANSVFPGALDTPTKEEQNKPTNQKASTTEIPIPTSRGCDSFSQPSNKSALTDSSLMKLLCYLPIQYVFGTGSRHINISFFEEGGSTRQRRTLPFFSHRTVQ